MRRPIRLALVAAAAMTITPAAAQPKERIVNVYNWSDYIAPNVVEDFSKETGIKVRYDTFDSNDTLETKLLAGKSGYDVVVPTAYFLERQIKAGVFQKLDKAKLPNLANMWPEISERLAVYDPGNQYAVNYMWGTTGIGYNVKKARDVLGANAKIDSWDIVFKPENLAKFKDCGVHFLDSSDDILAAALHYLSLDPNTTKEADLQKAADLVTKIRPYVRKFHSSEYLNALASGEICLVVGFSGDVKQSQKRALEAKNGVEIAYAIPKEGAQLWFDNLGIPRDSKNVAEADSFINYLQKPEVAAKNTNFISYANGNLASQKFIDKSILDDKTIYPDEATMKKLYTIYAHDPKTQRPMNRLWTRIKTGTEAAGSATLSSSPAPMDPQPLFRVLAHPAFDHRRDRLHGPLDVDLAVGIAGRRDRFGQIDAKAMAVGQADDARAVNRAIDVPRQAGDEGVRFAAPPEEGHVHAVHVMLVDDHGDVAAGFEHAQELDRRVEAGGHEGAHAAFADLDDGIADGADIGLAVEHRRLETILGRHQRRQFPIREMGGEDQSRLAVAPHPPKPLVDFARIENVAHPVRVGIEHLQAIDMGELGCHASEIVPNAAQDRFDFGRRFLRKGDCQIGAADFVFLEPRTKHAHEAAGEVGHVLAVGCADRPQHRDRQRSERGIDACLDTPADPMGEGSRLRHGRCSRRPVKRRR